MHNHMDTFVGIWANKVRITWMVMLRAQNILWKSVFGELLMLSMTISYDDIDFIYDNASVNAMDICIAILLCVFLRYIVKMVEVARICHINQCHINLLHQNTNKLLRRLMINQPNDSTYIYTYIYKCWRECTDVSQSSIHNQLLAIRVTFSTISIIITILIIDQWSPLTLSNTFRWYYIKYQKSIKFSWIFWSIVALSASADLYNMISLCQGNRTKQTALSPTIHDSDFTLKDWSPHIIICPFYLIMS